MHSPPLPCSLIVVLLLVCSATCGWADDTNLTAVADLLELVIDVDTDSARQCLATLARQIESGELENARRDELRKRLDPLLVKLLQTQDHPLRYDAALTLTLWKQPAAMALLRETARDDTSPASVRLRAVEALLVAGDNELLPAVETALRDRNPATRTYREQLLPLLSRSSDPLLATVVLTHYAALEPDLQPRAIELLTQRAVWSAALVSQVEAGKLPASVLHASQLVKLHASSEGALKKRIVAIWGNVRTERNPQREQLVADMRILLAQQQGDAIRGQAVFQKVCGQCHKLHGQGHDVGPDLTSNGRASFEQLLSNVFDPSLVIGPAYQARVLVTGDGRILTGLVAEENEQRVVLKLPGGKVETIARENVEEMSTSPLSLMPEGLEKQLTPPELTDLFALLTLDLPPSHPQAQLIPGTPVPR